MDLVTRVERTRLLLTTLNDPLPTVRGALQPDSGPAASRYAPCETCRSTGRVRARGGFVVCLVCDGRGEKRRRRDDRPYDAYLGMPLDEAAQLPREPEPARLPPPADAGYGWERAQEAYERHGSYRELRRHLDWLRNAHPRRYELVRAVLVEHGERELTRRSELELDLGVLAIALRMQTVRVPRWVMEPRAQPTQTVATLAAIGLRAGEIAKVLGMTKKAVRRALKKTVDSGQAGVPVRAT